MARRVDVEKKLIGHFKAPRANVLLVVHDEVTESPHGSILLPQAFLANRNERVGTVISVGSEIRDLKPGDRVLMDKRLGLTLRHEDEGTNRLVMVSEDQVLGLMEGKACDEDYDLVRDGL